MNYVKLKSGILCCLSIVLLGQACKENPSKETESLSATQYEEYTSLLPVDKLKLPEGFKIEVYADSIDGARSMALGANGTLFVGTRNENKVYAIQDRDKDFNCFWPR